MHHLTVEVADGGGEGAANTNTAELVIRVADTNDNAPEFSASQYQVSCSRATLSFSCYIHLREGAFSSSKSKVPTIAITL